MKSSYAKDIKIITANPYFHSLVARKIPKQPQQSNQNNNIYSSNPNAKSHKKMELSEQTQHKTKNPEFSFLFLDFLGNQTNP